MRFASSVALIAGLVVTLSAQAPVTPPPLPPDQEQRLNAMPAHPKLFAKLRVLRYEDVEARNDFGANLNRAVRLLALKEGAAR